MRIFTTLGIGFCLALIVRATDRFSEFSYAANDIIRRDFVIIGGGASGTYAAITLKDKGNSIILIERKGKLGGHTETYTAPDGTKVDIGVQAWHNDSITRAFFARFDIPLSSFTFAPAPAPLYVDFCTGKQVRNFSGGVVHADYVAQLSKYPYLNDGLKLPYPVPQDLLLPWDEYIQKYHLQDSAWATTAARPAPPGELLGIPAIYVFNALNRFQVEQGEDRRFAFATARQNNGELYEKAQAELGADALLHSTVTAGRRATTRADGVRLVVITPRGNKLIIAKQAILGIPPVLDNMKTFNLDPHEEGILSKVRGWAFYAGLISNTGLTQDHWYTNAAANAPYHVPNIPDYFWFKPTKIKGQFLYWYSASQPTSQPAIEAGAAATVNRLHAVAGSQGTSEPIFQAFANHTPFHPYVSTSDIANGFYRDMYNLQGYRNTWYIGALFVVGGNQIWNNTKNLLPDIIAAAGLMGGVMKAKEGPEGMGPEE